MGNIFEGIEFSRSMLSGVNGNASNDSILIRFFCDTSTDKIRETCKVIHEISQGISPIEADTITNLNVQLMRLSFHEQSVMDAVERFHADSKSHIRQTLQDILDVTEHERKDARKDAKFMFDLVDAVPSLRP